MNPIQSFYLNTNISKCYEYVFVPTPTADNWRVSVGGKWNLAVFVVFAGLLIGINTQDMRYFNSNCSKQSHYPAGNQYGPFRTQSQMACMNRRNHTAYVPQVVTEFHVICVSRDGVLSCSCGVMTEDKGDGRPYLHGHPDLHITCRAVCGNLTCSLLRAMCSLSHGNWHSDLRKCVNDEVAPK